jgi:hypothetical protein
MMKRPPSGGGLRITGVRVRHFLRGRGRIVEGRILSDCRRCSENDRDKNRGQTYRSGDPGIQHISTLPSNHKARPTQRAF